MMNRSRIWIVLCCLAALLATAPPVRAYSVLTHEQLIDLTWETSIVPLLKSRYPTLTPAQIEHARAYAYGGCVIQDIGYYPFGDPFFSDLTHYVRSGDFVVNLFRNAGNADELAFAVGALSHYIGDTVGHAGATNLAVPVEFPKLRQRYGSSVNYAQGEHQHVQTEFAFDINEIAHHRFAPVHYLRHVGLAVPTGQLALAFYQTYGVRNDFSTHRGSRINVDGYRFAVRNFIPRIAYAVTVLHRKHEPAEVMDADLQKLQAEITAVAAKNDWDSYRKKPGIGTYSLAAFLYILPKIGPIKLVAVKGPTQATESEYVHSVVRSSDELNRALRRFTPPPATVGSGGTAAAVGSVPKLAVGMLSAEESAQRQDPQHPLANRDLDTGVVVKPGGYRLTDDTYAGLLQRLAEHPMDPVPPGIRDDILLYYADLNQPFATKKKPEQWAALQRNLQTLRTMPTSTAPEPYATYGDSEEAQ
ncbi:MAG: zinc dependent phospholipase C family protein [Janthinobacterium lividum]